MLAAGKTREEQYRFPRYDFCAQTTNKGGRNRKDLPAQRASSSVARSLPPSVLPSLPSRPSHLGRHRQGAPPPLLPLWVEFCFVCHVTFSKGGEERVAAVAPANRGGATSGRGRPRDGHGDLSAANYGADRPRTGRPRGASPRTGPRDDRRFRVAAGRVRGGLGHCCADGCGGCRCGRGPRERG